MSIDSIHMNKLCLFLAICSIRSRQSDKLLYQHVLFEWKMRKKNTREFFLSGRTKQRTRCVNVIVLGMLCASFVWICESDSEKRWCIICVY